MAKKDNTNLIIGLVAVGLLVVGVALYLSKHHSKQGACSVSASAGTRMKWSTMVSTLRSVAHLHARKFLR